MHYELYISSSALKELKKLDSYEKDSIKTKLKLLALDPFNTSIDFAMRVNKDHMSSVKRPIME
jgi:mRNA-degrading endonuclease RelE of RelBE toxin-antitoxin system